MSANSLKHKATTSVVWTGLQRYTVTIIQFISGIILARLLSPTDYGCIGMLTIFISVSEVFIDGGFGSALIQKKNPTQVDYSTIFWWNFALATLFYVVLFFSAPAIARFYRIPLLSDVLKVEALVLFIYVFKVIQSNQLRKTLRFKIIAIASITTACVSLVVTVVLAYMGFGVWALVVQHLVNAAIPAIIYWINLRWKPLLVFSKQSFRELFGFGFYMFLSSLINSVSSKLTSLLIGRLYNPATLGYFSKAKNTEMLASHSISSILTKVTYPLYAQVQDDKARLGSMIQRLTMVISLITFPMMILLMLLAKPIFVLLYSDRWIDSVPYFQTICLVGLADCLQAINTQTIAAIGKSKVMFRWTIVKRIVGLVFMIGGLWKFGIWGLLIGMIVYNWFAYAVNIGLVSKYIGYKWYMQLKELMPVTLAVTVAGLMSWYCAYAVDIQSIVEGKMGLYVDGLIKMFVFVIIILGWIVIFKPYSFKLFMSIVPEKVRKHLKFLDFIIKT